MGLDLAPRQGASFETGQLKAAGLVLGQLRAAGLGLGQLRDAGGQGSPASRGGLGWTLLDASAPWGFGAVQLKGAGFDLEQLKALGLNLRQLKDAGLLCRRGELQGL